MRINKKLTSQETPLHCSSPESSLSNIYGSTDYYDYCRFIHQQDYNLERLERFLNIRSYRQSVEISTQQFQVRGITYGGFEWDISNMKGWQKESYHEIILMTCVHALQHLFSIRQVPITFISHGRHYQDANFSQVIGDFHDYIPMTFSVGNAESIKRAIQYYRKYKKFIRRINLNFIAYITRRFDTQAEISQLLSPFFFNSLIGLYHATRAEYESFAAHDTVEGRLGENSVDRSGVRPKYLDIEIVRAPHEDHIWLNITQNSQFAPEAFKEQFIKSYHEIMEELNR